MNRIAIKRTLALALAVGAGMLAGSASAQDGVPLYDHYFYSDATYTEQVGHYRDTCRYYGVGATATEGRITPYEQTEIYALCAHGQLQPY